MKGQVSKQAVTLKTYLIRYLKWFHRNRIPRLTCSLSTVARREEGVRDGGTEGRRDERVSVMKGKVTSDGDENVP